MNKYLNSFAMAVLLAALPVSFARAEDVDIFLTKSVSSSSKPNVLLALDVAGDTSSTITLFDGTKGDKLEMLRQVLNNIVDPLKSTYFPTCTVTGTAPTQTRSPSGCVTRQEVSDLLGNINLGLMIGNPPKGGNSSGGYVRSHIRDMSAASGNRALLLNKINPEIPKTSASPYAKLMHEAYLYYGGKTAYAGFETGFYDNDARSGIKYVSPAIDSCQSNYVVFVGTGGPDSKERNSAGTLLDGIGGKLPSDEVEFPIRSTVESVWFDEYARALKTLDVVPELEGMQNVTTYTIAVQNPDAPNYKTLQGERSLLQSAAF